MIQPPVLFFSFLLAPRAACLGQGVALFRLPFEARPVDPIRREVFRQASLQPSSTSSTWFTPEQVHVPSTPLSPVRQRPVGPLPKTKRRRR